MSVTEAAVRPLTPHDPRLAPWRAFLLANARLIRLLDEELRAEHDLSFAEYDALLTLASAADRSVRMHALADQVVLSKSGVTRLVDRLVADGLVERGQCPTDARGALAVLTESGLARLRAASRTHLRGIQTHFLGVIDEPDLAIIERSMSAVARLAGPGSSDSDQCLPDALAAGRSTGR